MTVNLVPPNVSNLDRQYQSDARISKTIRVQRYRLTGNFEVLNIFNVNGVQRFNNRVNATWPTPQDIQQPRIVQVSANFQF